MKNMDINKLKRPVKYGKIPLILLNKKGDHMFTSLKYQLEITRYHKFCINKWQYNIYKYFLCLIH